MHSFFWLYLTINAPDFRLILLDCNTYDSELDYMTMNLIIISVSIQNRLQYYLICYNIRQINNNFQITPHPTPPQYLPLYGKSTISNYHPPHSTPPPNTIPLEIPYHLVFTFKNPIHLQQNL